MIIGNIRSSFLEVWKRYYSKGHLYIHKLVLLHRERGEEGKGREQERVNPAVLPHFGCGRGYNATMTKDHWMCIPGVYILSRVIQAKVIPAAQPKQAETYIEQQWYRKMLEADYYFSEDSVNTLQGKNNGKPLLYFTKNHVDRKCKIVDKMPDDVPFR